MPPAQNMQTPVWLVIDPDDAVSRHCAAVSSEFNASFVYRRGRLGNMLVPYPSLTHFPHFPHRLSGGRGERKDRGARGVSAISGGESLAAGGLHLNPTRRNPRGDAYVLKKRELVAVKSSRITSWNAMGERRISSHGNRGTADKPPAADEAAVAGSPHDSRGARDGDRAYAQGEPRPSNGWRKRPRPSSPSGPADLASVPAEHH